MWLHLPTGLASTPQDQQPLHHPEPTWSSYFIFFTSSQASILDTNSLPPSLKMSIYMLAEDWSSSCCKVCRAWPPGVEEGTSVRPALGRDLCAKASEAQERGGLGEGLLPVPRRVDHGVRERPSWCWGAYL